MTPRTSAIGYALILVLGIAAGIVLSGCNGTALKRAADAGSVTIAATATARARLVAWTLERDAAIPVECHKACALDAHAVACFDGCTAAKVGEVDKVRAALRGYRAALEAAAAGADGDVAGVAVVIVKMAQEVSR